MSDERGGKTIERSPVVVRDMRAPFQHWALLHRRAEDRTWKKFHHFLPNASSDEHHRYFVPSRRDLPLHLSCLPFPDAAPGLRSRGTDLQRRPWTLPSLTNMTAINDISDLFDFPLYYEDDRNNTVDASPPAPPPTLLPYSYSPESTPTEPTDCSSPSLSEEENTHLQNLLWYGVDSVELPPPPPPPTHTAEFPTILAPAPPPFALSPTLTNVSIPSTDVDPGPASPTTCASPAVQTRKRRRSLTEDSDTSQPGRPTSSPRPATKPRLTVVPGESVFQLDVQVPAFTPNISSGAPMGKTRQRVDYSACKCPNKSKKPARHWKTACPYNKGRSENRYTCELCGETFSRHDNKDRHIEDFHP